MKKLQFWKKMGKEYYKCAKRVQDSRLAIIKVRFLYLARNLIENLHIYILGIFVSHKTIFCLVVLVV